MEELLRQKLYRFQNLMPTWSRKLPILHGPCSMTSCVTRSNSRCSKPSPGGRRLGDPPGGARGGDPFGGGRAGDACICMLLVLSDTSDGREI